MLTTTSQKVVNVFSVYSTLIDSLRCPNYRLPHILWVTDHRQFFEIKQPWYKNKTNLSVQSNFAILNNLNQLQSLGLLAHRSIYRIQTLRRHAPKKSVQAFIHSALHLQVLVVFQLSSVGKIQRWEISSKFDMCQFHGSKEFQRVWDNKLRQKGD